MARPSEPLTVAAGQMVAEPLSRAAAALEAVERLVRRAADRRVELLVLPECAYPAYALGSVDAYRQAAVRSTAEYLSFLADLTHARSLHIVTGCVEEDGDLLYNTAYLVDRKGNVAGRYRKQMLWDQDHAVFAVGETVEAVETELGRIGMLICADARIPELTATLVADGAQLIAMPTCWVHHATLPGPARNPQPEFLIEARAREFAVPFVCANKAGPETESLSFCGRSMIVRANGLTAAEAPPTGEALVVSRVALHPARRVWVSPSRRRVLLATARAVAPAGNDRSPIQAVAVPRAIAEAALENDPSAYYASLAARGVQLAVSSLQHEQQAEAAVQHGALHDVTVVAFPTSARPRRLPVATVGHVAGEAVKSFASARALALEGAEVLCIFAPTLDLALARTRALENRVYVLASSLQRAAIIAPDGTVLDACDADHPRETTATLDLSAIEKTIAPHTHVFDARQPRAYRF